MFGCFSLIQREHLSNIVSAPPGVEPRTDLRFECYVEIFPLSTVDQLGSSTGSNQNNCFERGARALLDEIIFEKYGTCPGTKVQMSFPIVTASGIGVDCERCSRIRDVFLFRQPSMTACVSTCPITVMDGVPRELIDALTRLKVRPG